jgi:L-amino acid N-acyltransferase YncA
VQIRPATPADLAAMWDIFQSVIVSGDALPFAESLDHDTFRSHWFGAHTAYVAVDDARVLGMYKLGPNYPDRGAHIASATYLVGAAAQGQGIGRAMVEHSIALAEQAGYVAMQFNYVVSSNAPAVTLYEKLGFLIVGTLPKAFRHQQRGLVDVYVMYRPLGEG